MQHPAIHDAHACATPSQRDEAKARRARLDRLAKAARTFIHCEAVEVPIIPTDKPEPIFSMGDWVERQKKIHEAPVFKKLWFSIDSEINPPEPRNPRIEEIQAACGRHYGVKFYDMISDRRTANLVRARQVGFYLCRELTLRSLPEIGRRFGYRDHTTVLHGIRRIEHLAALPTNYVASDIDAIKADITQRLAS